MSELTECYVIKWMDEDRTIWEKTEESFMCYLPYIGLDPRYELLVKRTPFPKPPFDARIAKLITTNEISLEYDSEFPDYRQWVETYDTVSRETADLIVAVNEVESLCSASLLKGKDAFKYLLIGVCLTYKRIITGAELPTKQKNFMENVLAPLGVKFWQNHDLSEVKKASITANQPVNLDDGFINS